MSRAENVIIGVVCMGAASMIAFPEPVSRSLIKLVQATDAELSRLLAACLSLESDYSGRNRALRKLTANALSIENLRHGFAFEEIGVGFSRTNLRRFLLECLEVASCASNLDIQLVAIRRLMDSGGLPRLNRALCRAREVVLASFSSSHRILSSASPGRVHHVRSAYLEETKLNFVKVGDSATVILMSGAPAIKGRVDSIARGIGDTENPVGQNLLQNVNATFEWVRLAQRIPVRIKLVEVPNGTILSSGMTATVRIEPKHE
jgi:hypothetical protein